MKRPKAVQKQRYTLGVETGTRTIRLVLLEFLREGGCEVRAVRSRSVGEGVAFGSPEYAGELREELDELPVGVRRNAALWSFLLPDRVRFHHLTLPVMAKGKERLDEAVYWAVQREESFQEAETLLDYVREGKVEEEGETRERITALLVEKADVEAQERLFRSIGYPLSGLVPPVRAGLALTDWQRPEEDPLIVAHVSEGTTRIHVLEGGIPVLSRSIPVGMMNLRDSEAGEGDLPGVLDRMARQLERTVEYYLSSSGWIGSIPSIRFSGELGGDRARITALQEALTVPLQVVDPFAGLQLGDGIELPVADEGVPYGTACGLALAGMEGGQNFLHTYRDRRLEERSHRWSRGIFAAFMVLVLVFGGWYAWELNQLHSLESERDSLLQERRSIPEELARAELFGLLEQAQNLREPLRNKVSRGEFRALLAEVLETVPAGTRLQQVSGLLRAVPEAETGSEETNRWIRMEGWYPGTELEAGEALRAMAAEVRTSVLVEEVTLRGLRAVATEPAGIRFRMELLPSANDEGWGHE